MNKNEIVPFDFHGNTIRTIVDEKGETWFVAKDVALVLGYKDTINAIKAHCKGVVKRHLPTPGGLQSMSVIPERDVYRLIMHSQLPAAEEFEEWVVGTVLPAIRKTGGYIMGEEKMDEDEMILAAMQMQQRKVEALRKQLEAQAPKVEAFESLGEKLIMSQEHILRAKRGRHGGTYAHWQIALAYAGYLSPDFHMWANQVVKERIEEMLGPRVESMEGSCFPPEKRIGTEKVDGNRLRERQCRYDQ